MENNIAICSNNYNGIQLFAYLGEYIYIKDIIIWFFFPD